MQFGSSVIIAEEATRKSRKCQRERVKVQARGRKPRAGLRAGAIEEPTLAVVGITRRTAVFASKQELASLDKKNELLMS